MTKSDVITAVVLVVLLAAGGAVIIPAVRDAKRRSLRTTSVGNLKRLGTLCTGYALGFGFSDRFPFDPSEEPRAYRAFQILVDASSDFDFCILCDPSQHDDPALPDAEGRYRLQPHNVSYAYRGAATTTSSRQDTILISNDTYRGAPNQARSSEPEGLDGGVNVFFVSGEARFMPIEELGADRSFPEGLVGNEGRTR
ncbi:MAG: hypothetical protein KDC38_15160 [Planctomycetes bacterium]|nr:hypothetical protein [Planctomycetota bacterium]